MTATLILASLATSLTPLQNKPVVPDIAKTETRIAVPRPPAGPSPITDIPQGSKLMNFVVRQVGEIDRLEPHMYDKPDWKFRIQVDDRRYTFKEMSDFWIQPARWFVQIRPTKSLVYLRIDVWDVDTFSDDHCDLNPAKGKKHVEGWYDFNTKKWFGDFGDAAGKPNLYFRGGGDSNRISVSWTFGGG
jgi:hypothetical protein